MGNGETILRTINGGTTWIGDEKSKISKIPKSVKLFQNYPNPFNPSTTIEFSLPKAEFVTLKIYNLLAQEVAILVSKQLKQGIHEYKWDATSFAGGVYFYKITAGDYVQTRKLLLIK